ncbi:hypothetical protein KM043_006000 [Ampulex compressa]|nr:hypothetical protein KM043_006000 [Ampulex compressa]
MTSSSMLPTSVAAHSSHDDTSNHVRSHRACSPRYFSAVVGLSLNRQTRRHEGRRGGFEKDVGGPFEKRYWHVASRRVSRIPRLRSEGTGRMRALVLEGAIRYKIYESAVGSRMNSGDVLSVDKARQRKSDRDKTREA